jgi:hypothetical protein
MVMAVLGVGQAMVEEGGHARATSLLTFLKQCTQAKAGTANLTTQGDVAILAASMPAPAAAEGLAALGLEYHDDDAEMDFDDD